MHAYIHQLCNTYYINKYNYKPSDSITKPKIKQLVVGFSHNKPIPTIPFLKRVYNYFMKHELNRIPTLATSHTVKYYKSYPLYTHSQLIY